MNRVLLALSLLGLCAACSDSTDNPQKAPAASLDGGSGVDASLPQADAAQVADGGGTAEVSTMQIDGEFAIDGGMVSPRGIVVVNSDYQSTSVSLLDSDGKLVKDNCWRSGLEGPGLSSKLSGDVVLASQPERSGDIVLIDRTNAVLTWVDPVACAATRQLSVTTGYAANPHDYVALASNKAYVVRWEHNGKATPDPTDFDDGDDLLIVDPSQGKITGRIALPTVSGFLPRGDRAMVINGQVFVSLNVLAANMKSNGPGQLAVVDPTTDTVVSAVDLPGLKNCGALTYVAELRHLFIACAGDFNAAPSTPSGTGYADVDLNGAVPKVVAYPDAVKGALLSGTGIGALADGSVIVIALGDFITNAPDTAWLLPPANAAAVKVASAGEAFALSDVLVDSPRNRVFIANGTATAPHLRRLDVTVCPPIDLGDVATNPARNLPPRTLAWY